jgi:hypothetical protein
MFYTLGIHGEEIGAIAVCGGIAIVVLSIVTGTVRRTAETKHREQSRREIAAYIAEGTISPEQGERLITAGVGKSRKA